MPSSNKRNSKHAKSKSTSKTNNKVTNIKEKNKKNKKKMNPKSKIIIKILLVIFLILCVLGAGIVAGIFFGLFGNEFDITKEELTSGTSNTVVLDLEGNEIASLNVKEKRKTISLGEMPEYLPKAYISIEDKRFYKHSGVDIKRTFGAIIGVITKNDRGGGSSITQQLVKNITNDKQRTGIAGITRKFKEWSKAIQIERMISKDQILELYLNIIFVGGDELHGVELASRYYFNKSAKDLDLAECAFLAGINHAPNSYSPYNTNLDQTKVATTTKNRTLTVLEEMKKQGLIEKQEDYDTAVAKVKEGLQFTKGYTGGEYQYSYHTAAAINQVVEQIMEEKNLSRDFAEQYVYGSGLTIYSTQDSKIQERVEEEFDKEKYQIKGREKNKDGTQKNDHTQSAIVIINNENSQVVAVGGELGNNMATGLNRSTDSVRQTGSSMKPLADIVPGLQEKVITPATIYDDTKTDFGGGYIPGNSGNSYLGLINIRNCIKVSHNIPMLKVMTELTPKKSVEYLKKMGITTLTEKDENIAIAIGGLNRGISTLEMAGAYSSIANDGVYTNPTFYTKVIDKQGNIVLTANQEKTRVISEQNAYLTRSILKEPTQSGGTATYCTITGMETCAKTGSTDDYVDRWLCGFTPYYTAACWFGFDNNKVDKPEPLTYQNGKVYSIEGKNPAGAIWSAIMRDIHKELPNKNFNKPSSGLTTAQVCKITGCIATSSCTDTYTETFSNDNLPQTCEGHGTQRICKESGKLANEYCPQEQVETKTYGGSAPKENLRLWRTLNPSKIGNEIIEEVCTIHKKPEEKPPENKINSAGNELFGNEMGDDDPKPGNSTGNHTVVNNTVQ